jgi:hypothetical protein
MNQYKTWIAFKYLNRCFLAMVAHDNNVHIYGKDMSYYGSCQSVENFKRFYAQDGENLNITAAEAAQRNGA